MGHRCKAGSIPAHQPGTGRWSKGRSIMAAMTCNSSGWVAVRWRKFKFLVSFTEKVAGKSNRIKNGVGE